ncbi:enoyl-CoA hydratase/isomerase family protein [Mycobacterium hodleri]|uniref:Enoyl-CoA hydratase/isomerase family protein n=1 Tax=Mycolicibacterium hodleri TaxID=49897 RepID=A0A502EE10_9MYCO|nr:enoyl-CoA hydratase/isomerase family protein [Mycolicibacterium hodleri]
MTVITVITLNRPDKLSALNHGLVEDLHRALDDVNSDDDCRVLVLTGAGRGFCSGLDLTDPMPDDAARGLEFPRSSMRWQERIAELTTRLISLRQPVIAVVAYVAATTVTSGVSRRRRRSPRCP